MSRCRTMSWVLAVLAVVALAAGCRDSNIILLERIGTCQHG